MDFNLENCCRFVDLEVSEEVNLPFRKTQSMRATTNRRIEIVDTLKQRRLSNTSLDREYKGEGSSALLSIWRDYVGVVCFYSQALSSKMRMISQES